jgi:hypothetical protein
VAAERVGRECLINERIVVDIWGRRRWVFAFSDFFMLSWQLQRRKDRDEAWPHGSVGVSVDGADSASTPKTKIPLPKIPKPMALPFFFF